MMDATSEKFEYASVVSFGGGAGGAIAPPKKNLAPPKEKTRSEAPRLFLGRGQDFFKKKILNFRQKNYSKNFLTFKKKKMYIFFFVLKSSGTYAKKILSQALFKVGGRGLLIVN